MLKFGMETMATSKINPSMNHSRQFIWQILVPVLLTALIGIGAILLILLPGKHEISQNWGAISLIIILFPALIFLPLLFALIFLLSKLLKKAHLWLPNGAAVLFGIIKIFNAKVNSLSDKITSPLIQGKSWQSGGNRIVQKVMHRNRNNLETRG
jgi:hypothetical protein